MEQVPGDGSFPPGHRLEKSGRYPAKFQDQKTARLAENRHRQCAQRRPRAIRHPAPGQRQITDVSDPRSDASRPDAGDLAFEGADAGPGHIFGKKGYHRGGILQFQSIPAEPR